MSTILILFVCVIAVVVIVVSKSKNNNVTIIGEENNDTPIFQDEVISENVNGEGNIIMVIDDVFSLTGRGTAVTGKIVNGILQVGDEVTIQSPVVNKNISTKVTAIEMFRKKLTVANKGDSVGVLISDVNKQDVQRGDYITK